MSERAPTTATVALPAFVGDDGINRAWENVSLWLQSSEPDTPITLHGIPRELSVEMAKALAGQLLAAVADSDEVIR